MVTEVQELDALIVEHAVNDAKPCASTEHTAGEVQNVNTRNRGANINKPLSESHNAPDLDEASGEPEVDFVGIVPSQGWPGEGSPGCSRQYLRHLKQDCAWQHQE